MTYAWWQYYFHSWLGGSKESQVLYLLPMRADASQDNKMVKETLTRAGVECSNYNGYSFRIGAATTALARGVPEATIQTLGCGKSDAYKQSIRIPREQLAGISAQMSQNTN